MNVELRFNESVISTGGFRQFFSSNSMGTYSIDLNQVLEKGWSIATRLVRIIVILFPYLP